MRALFFPADAPNVPVFPGRNGGCILLSAEEGRKLKFELQQITSEPRSAVRMLLSALEEHEAFT